MNYLKKCDCCGHQITAYTVGINKGLLEAFVRFGDYYLQNRQGISKHIMESLGIIKSNSQYTNFHNLQYFGIIAHDEGNREIWHLTPFGEKFFYNEVSVLSPVAVMAGRVLPDDHEAWLSHAKPRRSVRIDSRLDPSYKRWREYRQEKIFTN